jgi:DNA-directed RNA polymerase omega subunit
MKKKKDSKKENLVETLSLDRLVPNAEGSVFLLTRMAMLRATEIYNGSRPLVDYELLDKPTTIALREISEGKIAFKNGKLTKEPSEEVEIEDAQPGSPIKGES